MPTFSPAIVDSPSKLTRSLHLAALRHTATMRAACAAVTHAPTLDDCAAAVERLREELELLENSAHLYRASFDADLSEHIAQEVAQLPLSPSWLDASVAQLVLGLAAQLETSQRVVATSEVLLWQLAQEREHVDAARAALTELYAKGQADAVVASFTRWLPVALDTLATELHPAYLEALRGQTAALGLESNTILAA